LRRRWWCGRLADRSAAGPGLVLGTAGHIDHGKTRLVAALTGTDTDRLAEERRRGISIELGFAELELPSAGSIGVVDVPGHDRLVRTMVAGAGGIDLFLLVVAADDGVMPQTIEHLEVLRALGVETGVVALNKIDAADGETVGLVHEEIRELLPDAPVVAVSALRGDGIGLLREAIDSLAVQRGRERDEDLWPEAGGVLHVDRSFTIAGAGTVVTGTVTGAGFAAGATVTILPERRPARIRSIQVHGRATAAVGRGRRAALNLSGVSTDEVPRGAVLAAGSSVPQPSHRLDVRLLGAAADDDRPPRRVQVHHGTRAVPARLVPLGDGLAQLRLEAPLIARARDRVVLRSIAPPRTLGGAEVIDPDPRRHGPGPDTRWLRLLAAAPPAEIVAVAAETTDVPVATSAWDADSPLAWALPLHPADAWRRAVGTLLSTGRLDDVNGVLRPAAGESGEQARPPAEPDRTDLRLLAMIAADGIEPRPPQTLADELAIPRSEAVRRLAALAASGRLRRVSSEVYYPPEQLERLERFALEQARDEGSLSLVGLRDALRTSRKYSQALLEHLDRSGITVRRGDEHLLRPSAERRST